jgi:hypothetical protein
MRRTKYEYLESFDRDVLLQLQNRICGQGPGYKRKTGLYSDVAVGKEISYYPNRNRVELLGLLRLTKLKIMRYELNVIAHSRSQYTACYRQYKLGRTPACVKTCNSQDTMSAT